MSIKSKSFKGAKKVVYWYRPSTWKAKGWLWRIAMLFVTLMIIMFAVMLYWSREPAQFSVEDAASQSLPEGSEVVVGSTFVGTNIKILDTLLDKPGGFISNDVMPPGVLMDNIPSWEQGVLRLLRDTTLSLRDGFSRSQSQSAQVEGLTEANSNIQISPEKWMFPSAESAYEKAKKGLISYAREIADGDPNNAQFYARADNLANYLNLVSNNLGDITQKLSASAGDVVIGQNDNIYIADQAKTEIARKINKTPFFQLDNNFYDARGYSWALLHELKAVRVDFKSILEKKGAMASLNQIINELEKTQKEIWSPIILNGTGFGLVANHSLVMASYLSRANAAIIDLSALLKDG